MHKVHNIIFQSRNPVRRLLHIDASARLGESDRVRHGSHTRRLGRRFVEAWSATRPNDVFTHLDLLSHPPSPVDNAWIAAAFTPADQRSGAQKAVLAESDALTAALISADLVVIGAPMYNFGLPATLKAWIDNVVRVGVTFGFDRNRPGEPYWPMLPAGKRLVILTARGDYGYGEGERLEKLNLVEAGLKTPLAYIGLGESDTIAIEYDEFGDARLANSIAAAETAVEDLVARLTAQSAS